MTTYDGERQTQELRGRQQPQHGDGLVDQYIGYGRRPYSETKPFFLTSEFIFAVVAIAAIAIALGVNDLVNGFRGWLLITIVAAAYIISRGIAKAGARDPNPTHSGGDRY